MAFPISCRIYLLSLTKSNRYGVDQDLIKFGKESYKVSGNVEDDGLVKKYGIVYENNKKNVLINNKVIRRFVDYISQFCVISFEPNDLEIVKGSPGDRRNYLNIEISTIGKIRIVKRIYFKICIFKVYFYYMLKFIYKNIRGVYRINIKNMHPTILQLPITFRCNFKCVMCGM